MTNKILSIIAFVTIFSACKTADNNVETLVYSRQASSQPESTNLYKSKFIEKASGTYYMASDTVIVVDNSGSFKIDSTEYFIQDVISESQAVYVGVKPESGSNKKVYTYHGIVATGTDLANVFYKVPDYSQQVQLTEKDTEHAWEVNTFQPQNINWDSGRYTVFASKK